RERGGGDEDRREYARPDPVSRLRHRDSLAAAEPRPGPGRTPGMRANGTAVSPLALAMPILALAAITVAIYVVGQSITPDYSGTALFGKTATDTLPLKSTLASVVLGLAGFQLLSATWIYGNLPRAGSRPGWLPPLHRLAGVTAILVSLPIAYHCMRAYGVQTFDARIAVHSIAGCFVYGAFAAKVTIVRSKRLPGWTLPLAGGLLVTLVAVLWYTSALWYYNDFSVPLLK
ncbi:MAG TPA: DUF6529 family protein, partial [Solirubrobacterales bacterium]